MRGSIDQAEARTVTSSDARGAEQRLVDELARGPDLEVDEPSNFEAMTEAAFRERQFSKPCSVCKGTGARDLGKRRIASYERRLKAAGNSSERQNIRRKLHDESHCRACDGTGHREPPDRRNGLQRTWCEDCRGTGDYMGAECERCLGLGHLCLGKSAWWVTCRCPRCKGACYVVRRGEERRCELCRGKGSTVPLTALPHGSSKNGFGPDVGAAPADARTAAGKVLDPVAERDVGILEAFDGLRAADERLARILAMYRGPLGNRWGHGHPYGRAFAVWPETPAGHLLMAEAPEHLRRDHGARPLELLAVIRDREERARVPEMRVRRLLTLADTQARKLVEEARSALAEAVQG